MPSKLIRKTSYDEERRVSRCGLCPAEADTITRVSRRTSLRISAVRSQRAVSSMPISAIAFRIDM